jgi:hypothetical protein
MATQATLEQPAAKKWNWDRNKQKLREELAQDGFFIEVVDKCVKTTNGGASVTDAMRELKANLTNSPTDVEEQYNALSQTDKRLVVRKIMHTKYRAGQYTLVDAASTYRTGKKSGTKKYLAV